MVTDAEATDRLVSKMDTAITSLDELLRRLDEARAMLEHRDAQAVRQAFHPAGGEHGED